MVMTKTNDQSIFVVDDEPGVRKVLTKTLERLGVKVRSFASGSDCLKKMCHKRCDLLITDVKMPDMDGLELLTKAKSISPCLKALVLTGYGDVPMAVKAIKMGALDFIEKPVGIERLLHAAALALTRTTTSNPLVGRSLTKTEMKVLELIFEGKTNREIAETLSRSIKTIEVHRKHIMRKFDVNNSMDLTKRAIELGLIGISTK